MAAILAADARTLPEVRWFRRAVLQDRLMTHKEAVAWLEARGAKNGERILGSSDWQYAARTGNHPALAGLQALSEKLCARYNWAQAQAVAFVLTGLIPTVGGRISWSISPMGMRRLNLEVPAWYSEDDVLQMYRQARAQFQGVRAGKARYPRSLAERTAHMVVFVAERLDDRGKPKGRWEAVFNEWNATCKPGWAYKTSRAIASDFRRAERRLWRT